MENVPLACLFALIFPADVEPSPQLIRARKPDAGAPGSDVVKLATVAVNDFWNFSVRFVPVTLTLGAAINDRGSSISAAGRHPILRVRVREPALDRGPSMPGRVCSDRFQILPMTLTPESGSLEASFLSHVEGVWAM